MSEKDLERIKNIYGKRNPKTHIEQRCQRLYTKQLDGLSTRQLVLQHAQRESISEKNSLGGLETCHRMELARFRARSERYTLSFTFHASKTV